MFHRTLPPHPPPQGDFWFPWCLETVWFPRRLPRTPPRLVASPWRLWSKPRWHLMGWPPYHLGMVFTRHKIVIMWQLCPIFSTVYEDILKLGFLNHCTRSCVHVVIMSIRKDPFKKLALVHPTKISYDYTYQACKEVHWWFTDGVCGQFPWP